MFDDFRNRIDRLGGSVRDSIMRQSVQISESLFSNSTSKRDVIVNGVAVEAKITTDAKTTTRGGNGSYLIEFRDSFYPNPGTYVYIPDKHKHYEPWLILYESDDVLFPKHIIKKCNYFLRWKNSKGNIVERWAVFGDNTRIQDGEFFTASNKMILPRVNLSLILPCDQETLNIKLDKRFIVDFKNIDGTPDTFKVSNRNVISKTFNSYQGVIELSLNQHQFNPLTDSHDEMIADFFENEITSSPSSSDDSRTCEITYNGTSELKMGTPFKIYSARFYINGILQENVSAEWNVVIAEENKQYFTYEFDDNRLKIKCKYDPKLIGTHIRLIASNTEHTTMAEMPVKVVSSI